VWSATAWMRSRFFMSETVFHSAPKNGDICRVF